ncbi:MAG: hypothetical protein A2667_00025 [Candidatus Wildermuthbacteria bacterium RIFCSPHIGHO2_01_FULL_47_27]|uniref:Glycosyltransferase 2-like domain-containing protein n=2 Tax=Candidatus Wildermuthiibacteriota TaxID=1817923 RepID=A0A1G2RNX8_9BACT|nr:MAG: Glycosyl transferase family 2 [Parcubacteria group bacterium GW2011_GWA2_47_9]OHA64454.1 MAG: hypothetical protein A2667_00025 [Candidatus Wildermuthbacteria bacterium RIFCSPHIGHO2_01_FULL_47_27]OHA66868.1 MAG: hypothetical protein A3D59_04170 [Candidatus Wildermuthbacteria bacterium RIFCSPHIGHO2_02_FULL_47_17]OHA74575.1 MAG: hypothetical protein A3A32_02760 [Candidatus Wildermuthbacteria bacterium RIFCSPLOWO2_01_FULL_48_35]
MDFSIILPAYNEADNLPLLLGNLKEDLDKLQIKYEIIVVDNGSLDNTVEVLNSLKAEISSLRVAKCPEKGFGGCVLWGLAAAEGEVLGFMDADRQIAPEYLVEIYQKLKSGNLDFCKAVRVSRNDGLARAVISRVYNFIFSLMFGVNAQDINGKPKIFTRELYDKINLISKDWFLDAEIMIKIGRANCARGEVPISFLARKGGASGIHPLTVFEFAKNMIYWRFKI